MAFLSPLWLWAAAAGIVPVILHLVFKRRYQIVDWAAMRFLLQALEDNKRRLIINQVLLLIMRILILILAAVIFAGPVLKNNILGSGNADGLHILIIDNSASMNADAGSRFETAKETASGILKSLGTSRVIVLPMGAKAVSDLELPGGVPLDELETMRLWYGRIDIAAILTEAADLAEKEAVRCRTYIISDWQKMTWDIQPETPAGKALQLLGEQGDIIRISVNPDAQPDNIGITGAALTGRPPTAGQAGTVSVELNNYSDRKQTVPVQLRIKNKIIAAKEISISPKTSMTAGMDITFAAAGEQIVEVLLPDDGLASDNVWYVPVIVPEAITVLAVNGETSIEVMEDETDFFQKAMNPGGEFPVPGDIVIHVTSTDEQGFNRQDIAAYDLIVLANVMNIDARRVLRLEQYIENGGSLIIASGNLVDIEQYNRDLFRQGDGLMPCRLEPVIDHRQRIPEFTVFEPSQAQGVCAFMRKFRAGTTDHIRFFQYHPVVPGDRPDIRIDLVYRDGTPAVITRQKGGQVVFLNSTLDTAWTDFPAHALFLPFMRELVYSCVNSGQQLHSAVCGDPIRVPVPPETVGGAFALKMPNGDSVELKPFFMEKQYLLEYRETGKPGPYMITGPGIRRLIAMNTAIAEGNPAVIAPEILPNRFPKLKMEYTIAGAGALAQSGSGNQRYIGWNLAVLLGLLLIAEMLIAYRAAS